MPVFKYSLAITDTLVLLNRQLSISRKFETMVPINVTRRDVVK